MPTAVAANRLRTRAVALRALADRLRRLDVLTLHLHAGTDTWVGPSPQRCADALRAHRLALLRRAELLDATARRMQRRADELESLAAAPGPLR